MTLQTQNSHERIEEVFALKLPVIDVLQELLGGIVTPENAKERAAKFQALAAELQMAASEAAALL